MNSLWRDVVILAWVICGTAYAETHPFSIHDMLAAQRLSDTQLSPDGKYILFVLRTTDLEADRGRTDLWRVGSDGGGLRRLTSHEGGDFNPRWLPDGKTILFLSTRSGSSQVWKIAVDGGEAEQVTDQPLDVGNLVLSPDGRWLAFTMEVFVGHSVADTQERLEATESRQSSGRLYERIFVRHWDTWKDGRRSHLFVMPLSGGEAVDVMPEMDADMLSKPFGGPEEIAFSPDSSEIIFSAREAGGEEPWSTDFDLYRVPIDAGESPECLTEANRAWDTGPLFSPDGQTLAYLAMERPGYESDRFQIMLRDWNSGRTKSLTPHWDRSPSSLCWSPDGQTIYATAANVGQKSLFAIDASNGRVTELVHSGNIRSPQATDERIYFARCHLAAPVELYSVSRRGGVLKQLTRINDERMAQARKGDYEQFTFPGWNDETVHCYVVMPIDFDPQKRYPVAFLIHGGPQGSFGNTFHFRWNPQVYAAAGYAAVMVDFHGSIGYGQAFCDAIRGDWGGKPLVDLRKGLAAALKRYPWMDGERVGALGASFGGFMINWIAGQWPDRFRCLINHDGNLDERMAYFNTEELWFPEWDHEGTPWDNPEGYQKHNPVNHVQHWKTPMLVIHGAQDFRVVDTQGLATFNALQRRGVPSRLLYFPDENHWVLRPSNSIQWHNTVIGWLDQWVKD